MLFQMGKVNIENLLFQYYQKQLRIVMDKEVIQ